MGNKLCKKKGDFVDGNQTPNRQRSFKGIISKWNLKPKWKSDTHLNKQSRSDVEEKNARNRHQQGGQKGHVGRPLSKSSDWTDVPLVAAADEANDHNADVVHVKNAQLSLIFNDNHTPTPPPRKHHKKSVSLREKIKAVAKQGLQAVQPSNSGNSHQKFDYSNRKPVEEPICIKKIICYNCPHCEAVSGTCHRHRAHEATQAAAEAKQSFAVNSNSRNNAKSVWDRKASSSSTNSLPTQGKLSIAIEDLEDIDARSSVHSLPGVDNNDGKQSNIPQNTSTPNDLMSRARSFGSLLPQILLNKLSVNPSGGNINNNNNNNIGNSSSGGDGKAPLAEIESDDSFGGLEDWDVGLIEHYNPKDASLPRGVKMGAGRRDILLVGGDGKWRDSLMSNEDEVLASLEGMIVNDVEETKPKRPEPPQRKTESLLKKLTRDNSNRIIPLTTTTDSRCQTNFNRSVSVTPPPSPEKARRNPLNKNKKGSDDDHSKLMKVIEDYKHDEDKIADRTIDLYRNLSTEEALVKGISKTTSNVDTVTHCDITRKTYVIEDHVSKFDSPNVNEFKRMNVRPQVNNVAEKIHNDFLNAERRFVTETFA